MFYKLERWVLGYTIDDAGMVVDIFAAPVLGLTSDAVPRLRLGPITLLGSGLVTGPETGFRPADEDDLGLDEEITEGDDETGEAM